MYSLDTNVVIDFFNAKLPANARKLLSSIEPAISVITHIKLFASANLPEPERSALEAFVNISTIYDSINSGIVSQTIAIRQQHKTKLPDAIIAATAFVYSLTLISRNTSDFKNIQGLQVIDPYVL